MHEALDGDLKRVVGLHDAARDVVDMRNQITSSRVVRDKRSESLILVRDALCPRSAVAEALHIATAGVA